MFSITKKHIQAYYQELKTFERVEQSHEGTVKIILRWHPNINNKYYATSTSKGLNFLCHTLVPLTRVFFLMAPRTREMSAGRCLGDKLFLMKRLPTN